MVAEVKATMAAWGDQPGACGRKRGDGNVRVYTREGKVYEGISPASQRPVHVNGSYGDTKRSFDTTEVVLTRTWLPPTTGPWGRGGDDLL